MCLQQYILSIQTYVQFQLLTTNGFEYKIFIFYVVFSNFCLLSSLDQLNQPLNLRSHIYLHLLPLF